MFIGFDYGTSNCAVAVMEQGSPRLLTLGGSRYLPSTLHAPTETPSPACWPKGWHRPSRPNTSNCAALWLPVPRRYAARCGKRG